MTFTVAVASGRETLELHLGPDKSPYQIKLEMQGRRLRKLLADQWPDRRFFLDRDRGTISDGWDLLCRLEPAPGRAPTKVWWNTSVLRRLEYSKQELVELFQPVVQPNTEPEWSL